MHAVTWVPERPAEAEGTCDVTLRKERTPHPVARRSNTQLPRRSAALRASQSEAHIVQSPGPWATVGTQFVLNRSVTFFERVFAMNDKTSQPATLVHPPFQNVSEVERIACGVVGGLLLSRMSLRTMFDAVVVSAAAGLIYRAATGYCPLYARFDDHNENERELTPAAGSKSLAAMHSDHGETTGERVSRPKVGAATEPVD